MKKRISILLAIVMLFSVFSVTATAANGPSDEHFEEDGETYYNASISFTDFDADKEFDVFVDNKVDNNAIPGATYDRESNTLTLSSFKHPDLALVVFAMGNDFTVKVEGDNELDYIEVYGLSYGGSLNLIGTGLLVVNADKEYSNAINFEGGGSDCNFDIADETSVKIFSTENAVVFDSTSHEDIHTIFMDSGKDVEHISGGKNSYDVPATVEGIRISEQNENGAYKVTNDNDPNGIYSVNIYKEDDVDVYEVDKYILLEGIGMYISDPNFDIEELTKEEFDAAGYKIVTEMNGPLQSMYANDSDEGYIYGTGYIIDGYKSDDDPKDKDFMYLVDEFMLDDKTDNNHLYTVFKLNPGTSENRFIIETQTDGLTYNEIKEQGFEIDYLDAETKEANCIVIVDGDGDMFDAYKLKKDTDPNGIYAISDLPYYPDDYQTTLYRVVKNEATGVYEIDWDSQVDSVERKYFVDGTYTYRYEEAPVGFDYRYGYIDELAVCATSDERNIALDTFNEEVFSYNERQTIEIDGDVYPVFIPEPNLNADNYEPIINTLEDDTYKYQYDYPDYIKVKESATPDESETVTDTQETSGQQDDTSDTSDTSDVPETTDPKDTSDTQATTETSDTQDTSDTSDIQDTTSDTQDTTSDTQATTDASEGTTAATEPATGNTAATTAAPQAATAKPDGNNAPVEPAIKEIKKGVTASQADKFIKGLKTDKDPKGSKFGLLCARQKKVTKKAVTIRWNKLPKAKKYVVYSAKCSTKKGVMTPYKKTKTLKKTTYTKKKCKKGTYYKFLIVALDKNGKVLATSTTVHSTTKGGKYCNDKTVKVNKKSVKLKKGKTAKLTAKETPETKGKKVQRHRKVKYESSNPAVAKVNGKGKITAKKKGTAYIYVYPQNGLYKKVKVTVK